MKEIKETLKKAARLSIYYMICLTNKIQKKKIVFSNFNGMNYGCNPKYICEYLRSKSDQYELVWLVKNSKSIKIDDFPSNVRLSRIGTLQYYIDMATAEFWVSNTLHPQSSLPKRKGQYYIQTGHGSFGIKKIGLDTIAKDERKVSLIRKDASKLDVFLSHSAFETEIYARAFMYEGKVREVGHARNDIFLKDPASIRKKVRDCYSLDADRRILLYLPTFKNEDEIGVYLNRFSEVEAAMANRFGGHWTVMLRLHPRSKNQIGAIKKKAASEFVNATPYPDVQELMVAADAAITDFSSAIFDFILQADKPAFIYAPNFDTYTDTTGTYFAMEEAPMPLSCRFETLVEQIKAFDDQAYKTALTRFMSSKGSVEDGRAADRAARVIELLSQSGLANIPNDADISLGNVH